ncbi:MAG: type III glutamate--ammonia ligase [Thermoleophilia bacterium]|nr:type III glutamate--ammonia ligase [Thermoleophilia bacterium]MDH4345579.1 type III glutamate--ammonia ligase [Thermoleophilia bacterium]MDH5333074.1 type III glutamate--ammonia ligase [Thermoleophilia bacterium]
MAPEAATLKQIRNEVEKRGIEFFFAQFVDMYARPSAKLVPAANLDDLVTDGAGFAGFAAGEIGQKPSDPDIAAIPDLGSFTPVPWQPNLARFACDVTVEGEPWPYCPRTILRNVLARAREQGYEFKIGIELEYFLVHLREDGSIEVADRYDTLDKPCYDMAGLTRQYDFLTTVSRYCNELGWGNYANDHEDANGQFEQNFTYDDALVTCDRAIFFRYMVHTLAEQHGMIATFMPKPFTHLTGNGCHFHMSLWRDGDNVLLDEADPRGLGLSETGYAFIGGLKAHARAYSAITAPTVNSYKRLKPGTTSSGATWSPVWISYGYNNRTQMLRIPGPGRIEDRTIDGSCNPYLAAAAVLASGLDGVDKGLDAGEPNNENLYAFDYHELTARGLRSLPANLLDATQELEADEVLRAALGTTAREDYVDYFVRVKRDEWFRYHEQVTDWELREYLTRF